MSIRSVDVQLHHFRHHINCIASIRFAFRSLSLCSIVLCIISIDHPQSITIVLPSTLPPLLSSLFLLSPSQSSTIASSFIVLTALLFRAPLLWSYHHLQRRRKKEEETRKRGRMRKRRRRRIVVRFINDIRTIHRRFIVVVPILFFLFFRFLPSLSNNENASLNSAICSSVRDFAASSVLDMTEGGGGEGKREGERENGMVWPIERTMIRWNDRDRNRWNQHFIRSIDSFLQNNK